MPSKMQPQKINHRRLLSEDLKRSCKDLSLYLLGKFLVRKLENDTILKGRIVETESYLGGDDKGSHTYGNRRTPACEPMYMPAGTSYVYMTYGMYHCLNISSEEPGAAVLIRALEPLTGTEAMEKHRADRSKSNKVPKPHELCNGPSKLCIAMDITKDLNKADVIVDERMWLEDDPDFDIRDFKVVRCARIGIPRAGEWASKPLRYYLLSSECVSKRDRVAERESE